MWLKRISILNYKNLEQAELAFSRKMNCIIGKNGMGKTNLMDAVYYLSFCKSATNPIDSQNIRHEQDFFVLQGFYETEGGDPEEVYCGLKRRQKKQFKRMDAVYYLSFCKSATNPIDSQNIRHEQDFFVLQGFYETEGGDPEEVYCGLKRRQKKQFKRNKKEYTRLSDHIGLIPLVMVSPADTLLIAGGSEERRRFMDVVISQFDREYLDALIRYNKALVQRNTLLKAELEPDEELMNVWEEMMASTGEVVFRKRQQFIEEFIPIFQSYYSYISQNQEEVKLSYQSHAAEGDLLALLRANRQRDRVMGYSLKGIHKDDLIMQLGEFPMKREGSQGQNKTYLIALKLAQFEFLKRTGSGTTPLILLDDIFDKLDALRVEQIVKLVAGDNFGQIFITDTNRDHLDRILKKIEGDYKLFEVENGEVSERKESYEAE